MNSEWMVMAPSVYYGGLLCMGIPTLIAFDILLYLFVRDLMTPRPAFAPASQSRGSQQPQHTRPRPSQGPCTIGILVIVERPLVDTAGMAAGILRDMTFIPLASVFRLFRETRYARRTRTWTNVKSCK